MTQFHVWWTGLPVEESIRMTEDRDKWRKYVHGVANARIKPPAAKEQNRTDLQLWGSVDT